ncbi:MAG: FdhF/YdeP family oxidoreductase [Myxococcota bacterium]|nr:FdhF/YdeP family oxidoreductase [Myxococcota bacterium]
MSSDIDKGEPPVGPAEGRQGETKTFAGGLPAITSTMRHVLDQAGIVRGIQALMQANQPDGFDCPGCAWPDPEHRTAFEFCENGAKAIASEATSRRAGPELFERYSVDELLRQSDMWLNECGRLTHPLILRPGESHYTALTWDDALAHIGQTLRELAHPDEAIFYTSGRTSNEAAFLYQLFVRCFGTNNLPDCSNMCHESSGTGLGEAIGIGKGTVTLQDFEKADLIWVVGQNPGTNHPRMLTALQGAVRSGARIVSINPLREAGLVGFRHPQRPLEVLGSTTALSSDYVQVRINGDVALMKAVMKEMLTIDADPAQEGRIDRAFIADRTTGFEAFRADLEAESMPELLQACGVREDVVATLARQCLTSRRMILCWAMGLTQHENGVANVQSAVNLLLLGGHFGRPGAGACPVRGHSNVQGDRTMGIWEKPPDAFLDRLEAHYGFSAPRAHGVDAVAAIEAMHVGAAKVFFAMGGNFLSAAPDTHRTAAALQRCELTVSVATKLNRGHLITGRTAIILPCRARTERDLQPGGEQFVTVENSMGFVHASRGRFEPADPTLRSEPHIVAGLAAATLGTDGPIDWASLGQDYAAIRAGIAACIPGFEDFERRLKGGGFYLPNGPREGHFTTPDGMARFTVHGIPPDPLGDGQLMMMTIRSHDQYNTTVYAPDDRYRGVYGNRRVILMNARDIDAQGLASGQQVDITSHFRGEKRRVHGFTVLPYDVPPRCCATYFPETNPLVPVGQIAHRSRTPASKSIVVTLAPSQAPPATV